MKYKFDGMGILCKKIICSQDLDTTQRIIDAGNGTGLDIKIVVNGIELDLDFKELFDEIEHTYDWQVHKEAKEIVESISGGLAYQIEALLLAQIKGE